MTTQIPLEELLVIDIETVSEKKDFSELSPEWQTLWDEKTKWSRPDDTDAGTFYPQRAGVMAEFAQIICISIGFFYRKDNQVLFRVKAIYGDDERNLLERFTEILAQFDARQ